MVVLDFSQVLADTLVEVIHLEGLVDFVERDDCFDIIGLLLQDGFLCDQLGLVKLLPEFRGTLGILNSCMVI